jgi:hypothetical protein
MVSLAAELAVTPIGPRGAMASDIGGHKQSLGAGLTLLRISVQLLA